jgi:predicted  nucleic acid-binding Zn-ribbon protein
MFGVGVYDQMKRAFQDLIAPEIHALRGDIRVINEKITALDQKIDSVETRVIEKITDLDIRLTTKIDSLRNELISEIRRLDTRIDGVDRELHAAIDVRERLAALEARRSS